MDVAFARMPYRGELLEERSDVGSAGGYGAALTNSLAPGLRPSFFHSGVPE
ncbi:MAG TPA: hypothetical protein VHL78_00265 [Actinomycetota bacterium]|nr:hypothetical protein [Actinomycetota bacterium]